jgi:ketosteroid isomerase-like protein
MVKTGIYLFNGFLLLALAGCNTPPPAPVVDVAAETAKLHEVESAWVKEAAAKDVDKVMSHYTDDATLVVSGMPAMKGKDAVRGMWQAMIGDPNFKLDFSSQKVEVSKDG